MSGSEVLTRPETMPESDASYSNFGHEWDDGAKDALENGEFWVRHAGWNFNAQMWRGTDGKYHSEVWSYHAVVDVITADTPDELVDAVNEKWGYD